MKMIELQIFQEFEAKPSQVLIGFARMGYGMSATAQAIGCHRQTVKRMAARFGVQFPAPGQQNAMCKRGPDRDPRATKAWRHYQCDMSGGV